MVYPAATSSTYLGPWAQHPNFVGYSLRDFNPPNPDSNPRPNGRVQSNPERAERLQRHVLGFGGLVRPDSDEDGEAEAVVEGFGVDKTSEKDTFASMLCSLTSAKVYC